MKIRWLRGWRQKSYTVKNTQTGNPYIHLNGSTRLSQLNLSRVAVSKTGFLKLNKVTVTVLITDHFQVTSKMCYPKRGLCHQNLEVIKPASGIAYIRCSNWKECPSFCLEESLHGYQKCVCDRVIPEYKVCEGGKPPLCKHMDTRTLRVSRSAKNPFRPLFTCRKKEMRRYFQRGDEMPLDAYSQREVYKQRETEMDMRKKDGKQPQRPKLQRQFARTDKVTDFM